MPSLVLQILEILSTAQGKQPQPRPPLRKTNCKQQQQQPPKENKQQRTTTTTTAQGKQTEKNNNNNNRPRKTTSQPSHLLKPQLQEYCDNMHLLKDGKQNSAHTSYLSLLSLLQEDLEKESFYFQFQ